MRGASGLSRPCRGLRVDITVDITVDSVDITVDSVDIPVDVPGDHGLAGGGAGGHQVPLQGVDGEVDPHLQEARVTLRPLVTRSRPPGAPARGSAPPPRG